MNTRYRTWVRGTLSVIATLILWEAIARLFFVSAVLPAPSAIIREMVAYAATGRLGFDVLMSVQRVAVGFFAGSALGAVLGLLLGSQTSARWLLDPPLQFFRFIPPIAWLTPVLIWFGIGENGKYVLITYTTTFMVMINTYAGVVAVQRNRLRAARCLGAGPLQVFLYVIVPSTMPFILTGMQIGMANSLQTVIVAEMLAANEGLGHLIISSRVSLATELAYVGIFLLGVLGLLSDTAFRKFVAQFAWRYRFN
ncbi:ABC transporter permease [Reyranella sp. CPCC 100927]|uniref:ABC transporter permease n=1 Tax=Reyranella sp. CPCC 100927 TaxID=2599616 RepID=UPI0011B650F3|nr:ABC transporter permease [Reyranella sp. CPCC 100927]TWT13952.1 ABC transporter permease [Reyranella sp. CPCC 100927]